MLKTPTFRPKKMSKFLSFNHPRGCLMINTGISRYFPLCSFFIYLLYFSAIFQNKLVLCSCNLCDLRAQFHIYRMNDYLETHHFSNEKIDWGDIYVTPARKKAKLEVFPISYPPEDCIWYVYIIITRIMYVSYKRQIIFHSALINFCIYRVLGKMVL